MEFFATTETPLTSEQLTSALTIAALPDHCDLIDTLLQEEGDRGVIYCLWGEFAVHRQPIRGGVRFTLPGCPNALAWSVTLEPAEKGGQQFATIHCTINRTRHDPDFIESIEMFVDAWRRGVARLGQG